MTSSVPPTVTSKCPSITTVDTYFQLDFLANVDFLMIPRLIRLIAIGGGTEIGNCNHGDGTGDGSKSMVDTDDDIKGGSDEDE